LLRAAAEHRIDLDHSWMVGDILDDVEAGHRAGCKAVLVANGHETEWNLSSERRPEGYCSDLAEAASAILAKDAAPPLPGAERGAPLC
jgi:D-glycero-D-manno-heptose 1,7-bisphosphate phosphatase